MLPDPRTVLISMIVISAATYGNSTLPLIVFSWAVIVILLFSLGLSTEKTFPIKEILIYSTIFWSLLFLIYFLPQVWETRGVAYLLLLLNWVIRFSLVAGMGIYAIKVVRPTMLSAGLNNWKIPMGFTISLSVALRIIPVLKKEGRAIREAIAMRGIGPLNPRFAEYFAIPFLSTIVRAGDDLAAAALIRGLGGCNKPTTIIELKPRVMDAVIIIFTIAIVVWRVYL